MELVKNDKRKGNKGDICVLEDSIKKTVKYVNPASIRINGVSLKEIVDTQKEQSKDIKCLKETNEKLWIIIKLLSQATELNNNSLEVLKLEVL